MESLQLRNSKVITYNKDLLRIGVAVLNLGADGPVAVREVEGPGVDPLVARDCDKGWLSVGGRREENLGCGEQRLRLPSMTSNSQVFSPTQGILIVLEPWSNLVGVRGACGLTVAAGRCRCRCHRDLTNERRWVRVLESVKKRY